MSGDTPTESESIMPSLLSSTKIDGISSVSHEDLSKQLLTVSQEVLRAHKNLKIRKEDDVFVSIGWTFVGTLRLFKVCPHVITLDITAHTNRRKYHLLTFSTKTSIDKQVAFLRLWLPNQRRLSFRWVFQHAVPKLIPLCHRVRVELILKDGDMQQQN